MKDMGLPDRPAAALRHSRPVGLGRIVPDGPRRTLTLLVVGVLAWSGLAWIGARLAQSQAVGVGFDLRLLLDAGRKAAAGQPLYDQGMVSGQAVEAQSLFYSYPPFVAQLLAPIAGIPHPVVLVAWAAISTATLAWVAVRIARRFTAGDANPNATATATTLAVALPVVALAPFVLPYGIGLLFGNLNTIFPFLYGLLLLAAAGGSRNERVAGGVALGIAAATKLHPASLGLWFLVRGLRERRDGERPRSWEVVAVAAATVGALAGFSLLVGGTGSWSDYLAVVRAGTGCGDDRMGRVAPPGSAREPRLGGRRVARDPAGHLVPLPGCAHPTRGGGPRQAAGAGTVDCWRLGGRVPRHRVRAVALGRDGAADRGDGGNRPPTKQGGTSGLSCRALR
jgi:hypothetical protein